MLKFLQNRPEEESPKRSPIKYKPEMCYGNSFEAPQEFQTKNTIFYRRSYVNPFLKFEKNRQHHISSNPAVVVHPQWTKKINLSMIQQHKILKDNRQASYDQHKSRYLDSFHREFATNGARFRITRGQFTDYIDRNNQNKPFGPMQGKERTDDRILETKRSVWVKLPSKRDEMTASLRYASPLNVTVKSSISKNTDLITDKIRIRRNREQLQKMYQRGLENRIKETKYAFDLPNKGPQHQLYLLEGNLTIPQFNHKNNDFEQLQELQKFDCRLDHRLN